MVGICHICWKSRVSSFQVHHSPEFLKWPKWTKRWTLLPEVDSKTMPTKFQGPRSTNTWVMPMAMCLFSKCSMSPRFGIFWPGQYQGLFSSEMFLLYRYGRYMPYPLKKSGFKLPSTPEFLKWPKWTKNELFFLRSDLAQIWLGSVYFYSKTKPTKFQGFWSTNTGVMTMFYFSKCSMNPRFGTFLPGLYRHIRVFLLT